MVNEKAPAFRLKNQDGEYVSLTGLAGKYIVLYFYPKDDTPGCTLEGQEFSALLPAFTERNAVVLGVSRDSVESHGKFCEKYGFGMDMLSDEDGAVSEAYGALREKTMFGKKTVGIARSTVVIDPDGIVRKHWRTVKAAGHAETVLAWLSENAVY